MILYYVFFWLPKADKKEENTSLGCPIDPQGEFGVLSMTTRTIHRVFFWTVRIYAENREGSEIIYFGIYIAQAFEFWQFITSLSPPYLRARQQQDEFVCFPPPEYIYIFYDRSRGRLP